MAGVSLQTPHCQPGRCWEKELGAGPELSSRAWGRARPSVWLSFWRGGSSCWIPPPPSPGGHQGETALPGCPHMPLSHHKSQWQRPRSGKCRGVGAGGWSRQSLELERVAHGGQHCRLLILGAPGGLAPGLTARPYELPQPHQGREANPPPTGDTARFHLPSAVTSGDHRHCALCPDHGAHILAGTNHVGWGLQGPCPPRLYAPSHPMEGGGPSQDAGTCSTPAGGGGFSLHSLASAPQASVQGLSLSPTQHPCLPLAHPAWASSLCLEAPGLAPTSLWHPGDRAAHTGCREAIPGPEAAQRGAATSWSRAAGDTQPGRGQPLPHRASRSGWGCRGAPWDTRRHKAGRGAWLEPRVGWAVVPLEMRT